jgi:hypothetical protein
VSPISPEARSAVDRDINAAMNFRDWLDTSTVVEGHPQSRISFRGSLMVTRSAKQKSQTVADPAKLAKALGVLASKAKSVS